MNKQNISKKYNKKLEEHFFILKDLVHSFGEDELVNKSSKIIKNMYEKKFPNKKAEDIDWISISKTFVNRDLLPYIKRTGQCLCQREPFNLIDNMEGFNVGNQYRFEKVDNPKIGLYYRVFHDYPNSDYYETCNEKDFKKCFSILINIENRNILRKVW